MSNQRKRIIINPKYQYKTALLAVFGVVLSFNVLLFAGVFFPLQTGLYVNFSGLQILVVGLLEVALVLFVWMLSIRLSLRQAGPAYAFGRELAKLAYGDLTVNVTLRPGDAFQDVADEINVGLTNLRLQIEGIKITVKEFDKTTDPQVQKQQLAKLKFQLDKLTTRNDHLLD